MCDAGVVPSDESIAMCALVKKQKLDWVAFKLDAKGEMVIPAGSFPADDEGKAELKKMSDNDRFDSWEERVYPTLLADIESCAKEGRYYVIDFRWKTDDGRSVAKVALLTWNPDKSKIKSKMIISSTTSTVFDKFGLSKRLEATDADDVTLEVLMGSMQ